MGGRRFGDRDFATAVHGLAIVLAASGHSSARSRSVTELRELGHELKKKE